MFGFYLKRKRQSVQIKREFIHLLLAFNDTFCHANQITPNNIENDTKQSQILRSHVKDELEVTSVPSGTNFEQYEHEFFSRRFVWILLEVRPHRDQSME
jgi:hypothetical protein